LSTFGSIEALLTLLPSPHLDADHAGGGVDALPFLLS